ncbi:DUF4214 domain-containing protein [Massilia sp. GCM10020059]|uniref:DUF4214 domain-containing protein n=1 Tax=Massilia agrisoli TaxID=2892444 RepID=A0ABS8IVL4_9BURK|nr:DUF4214 domain-containing protein [Massilia agrisoli]MCC6071290.1 DUF4214 domain-containing protein [Massilia agrisoli]
MIQSNPMGVTTLNAPSAAPVVIFQGGGVNATFANGQGTANAGVVERVVVGTAAADKIIIADNVNTQVIVGDGDTVVGGAGADTIVAGVGDTTVQGGTGYTIVSLTGSDADYTVTTTAGGQAVITGANGTTTLDGVQFVQLSGGDALVIASNAQEAAVAALYEATFGRAADANGLDFWFDRANAGTSLDAIAEGFLGSAEYKALGSVTDAAFVNNVYVNTFGKAASAAELALWTTKLASGVADRADVLTDVTNRVAADLADNTEVEFIGSVTIITTII